LPELVALDDHGKLLEMAREHTSRVLRYLIGRLYSGDEAEKWRAVRALGVVVGDRQIVNHDRATNLLRRFVWALNDESGAVPYGVPEAIGEVLAVRCEFQEAFLPILCSVLTEDDMIQTGPIERGALWAVGRVGRPVARYSAEVVAAVKSAAGSHAEAKTRETAARSLKLIESEAGETDP
jgi:hypothetical protein